MVCLVRWAGYRPFPYVPHDPMEYVLHTLKFLCPRLKFTDRTYSIVMIDSNKIPESSLPGTVGHLPPSPGVPAETTLI